MSGAKIQLSAIEMDLVQNSHWILTKRDIIEKVYNLFGILSEDFTSLINKSALQLPGEIITLAPKISKGENYHGLPYVVLDYPRYFDKENSFAVRSFFWWGNFFSSTILLKGKYKNQFADKVFKNYTFLSTTHYSICIGDNEWDFRFDENNFKPVAGISVAEWKEIIYKKEFIKLSVKISLQQWEQMQELLTGYFKNNLTAAGINFQDGEINL